MNELPRRGRHRPARSQGRNLLLLELCFFFQRSISVSLKARRAVGPATPETGQPEVPLCLVEGRRQELKQTPCSESASQPTQCPLLLRRLEHPAFPPTRATFQERLRLATVAPRWRRTWSSVLHLRSEDCSTGQPLCPAPAQSQTPFPAPIPLKDDGPTQLLCCGLTRALLSGSAILVPCLPEGIVDSLTLFHWLISSITES